MNKRPVLNKDVRDGQISNKHFRAHYKCLVRKNAPPTQLGIKGAIGKDTCPGCVSEKVLGHNFLKSYF